MGRILIPCPFDDDVLAVAKVFGEASFKGEKQQRGHSGTRAQIAACKALSSRVPGDRNAIIDDCLKRLRDDPYGKIDSCGMDFKDRVLKYGTAADAIGVLSLQASTPIEGAAEMYVQTFTDYDEKACHIVGWLYWRDVLRLGHDCGEYVQVPVLQTYEPWELIDVLNKRYRV